jgi:hypothetical protein
MFNRDFKALFVVKIEWRGSSGHFSDNLVN